MINRFKDCDSLGLYNPFSARQTSFCQRRQNDVLFLPQFPTSKYHQECIGGYVLGNHTYLKQIANIGHEIYNFKRTRNGFCAYIPPSAGNRPQLSGRNAEDWFVVFLARENGNGQLCVVGYYENARIYDKRLLNNDNSYGLSFPNVDAATRHRIEIAAVHKACRIL